MKKKDIKKTSKKRTNKKKNRKKVNVKRISKKEMRNKKRRKRILLILLIIFVSVLLLCFILNNISVKNIVIVKEPPLKEKYNECLNKKYTSDELNTKIVNLQNEIDKFIKENNYDVAVKYEDLKTGFSYSYKEDKIFYGASLIKLVDALYLIDKAIDGEVDLDQIKLKYTSQYAKNGGIELSKRKVGENISLRDLIRYAITVSDNAAHLMLIDYIGTKNLKNYAYDLGAKVILTGGDKYGNQTAQDTNIYLKRAYEIITTQNEYGLFLKEIMDSDFRNSFNTEEINIYHKYGSLDIYYHDVGLNLDIKNPYAISIFTTYRKENYKKVIQSIHAKIIELHNLFYEERKLFCEKLIYNK